MSQDDYASPIDFYRDYHTHPTNQLIHAVCIPLIAITLQNLLSLITVTIDRRTLSLNRANPISLRGNIILSVVFQYNYAAIYGTKVFFVMLGYMTVTNFLGTRWRHQRTNWAWESLVIHLLAWAAQFYGHLIEGRRPALIDNFGQAFLSAPLFAFSEVFWPTLI